MTPERRLIDRLLALYWLGGVTQCQAAMLLGIRKQEFAEYAELREGQRALERVANEYLVRAFNHAFPWCDPALMAMHKHAAPMRPMSDDVG